MSIRVATVRAALLCTGLAIGAALAPTVASARTYVDIAVAPPPPREEVVPAPRHGYVWAPGYWSWHHNDHVWVAGHWIHHRSGHHWVAERWEDHNGKWHFTAGHWDRD